MFVGEWNSRMTINMRDVVILLLCSLSFIPLPLSFCVPLESLCG
jgi:hypothetical protein